jgi:uncharacterized protein YjbI with pentapeptide repeats
MKITNEEGFIDYLKTISPANSINRNVPVENKLISNISFEGLANQRFKFKDCRFINCQFDGCSFYGAELDSCEFDNCSFQDVTVMNCALINCTFDKSFSNTLYFGMTTLENVKFNEVFFQYIIFSDCSLEIVSFTDGQIHVGKFETGDFTYDGKSKIIFKDISLGDVVFSGLDLTNSNFHNSGSGTCFFNCTLARDTFKNNEVKSMSSIDFPTLLKSEDLSEETLMNVFGINDKNVKRIISQLTIEPKFHSVFISYSFKDAKVGKELKRLLTKNGIKTFLWENDAPGGKKLKRIMIDEIHAHDKFLFIASENSLKSEACHYEISEARIKYIKSWLNLFVPIHIDSYLFDVRKEDIPSKLSKRYWQNIKELRETNSLDFTFTKGLFDIEGSEQFTKLIESLRIKK